MAVDYLNYPAVLDVEITSACNMKCVMCPRSRPDFKNRGHMSEQIFGRIYRELVKHKGWVHWIWLHVGGESLLHPKFVEWADLLSDRALIGADTAVSTNVTPLTERKAREVLSSRLNRLVLSVDGVTKEIYEAIRVGGHFEDVMKKLHVVLEITREMEAKNQHHPNLWLQCLRMDDTQADLRAFAEKFGEGRITKYQRLKGIEHGKLFMKHHEGFAFQIEPRGKGWDAASGKGRRFKCRKPFKRATILADGGVSICCYDILGRCIVGSLEDNSLAGIWRSQPFQEIRAGFDRAQKRHKRGEEADGSLFPELCREC